MSAQPQDPFADISDLFASGDDREANRAYARASAIRRGLDPDFVDRLFMRESGYNRKALNKGTGAAGIGQQIPATQRRFGLNDPFDAKENIDKSLEYLSLLNKQFKGDQRKVAAGYFAGEGDAEAALANPQGNPKTNAYANAIAGDPFADIADLLEGGQTVTVEKGHPSKFSKWTPPGTAPREPSVFQQAFKQRRAQMAPPQAPESPAVQFLRELGPTPSQEQARQRQRPVTPISSVTGRPVTPRGQAAQLGIMGGQVKEGETPEQAYQRALEPGPIGDIPKAIAQTLVGFATDTGKLPATALADLTALLSGETPATQALRGAPEAIEQRVQAAIPVQKPEALFTSVLPGAVASSLPFMLLPEAAGAAGVAGLSALQSAGQSLKESQKAGATKAVQYTSAIINGLGGATEVFGVGGAKLRALGAIDKRVSQAVKREAFEEFWQSGGQRIIQNLSAFGYDPNRKLDQGALDDALLGFFVGGLVGGGTQAGANLLTARAEAKAAAELINEQMKGGEHAQAIREDRGVVREEGSAGKEGERVGGEDVHKEREGGNAVQPSEVAPPREEREVAPPEKPAEAKPEPPQPTPVEEAKPEEKPLTAAERARRAAERIRAGEQVPTSKPGVSPVRPSAQPAAVAAAPAPEVAKTLDRQKVLELIDRNSPGVALNFSRLRNAIGEAPYKLSRVRIDDLKFEPGSEGLVKPELAQPQKGPIVVGPDGVIIDGRHRALLAKQQGAEFIDAYVPEKATPAPEVAKPEAPKYAYRVRDVGEEGIPARETHPQAGTDEARVKTYIESRGKTQGRAQEVVRVDLSKLSPEDYEVRTSGGIENVLFKKEVPEAAVERYEAKPAKAQTKAEIIEAAKKQVAERELAKNWREVVDSETNPSRKADILRDRADNAKSPDTLSDVLSRVTEGMPEEGNILWAISQNPRASDDTRAKAKERYAKILPLPSEKPLTPTEQEERETREARRESREAKEKILAEPWKYSAEQYQAAKGVHAPWIGEISLVQYSKMGKQQKAQYDAKRAAEWQASADVKDEWRKELLKAVEEGKVTEDSPELSREAKSALFHEGRAKVEATKKTAMAEASKANRLTSPDDVDVGDTVFDLMRGKYVEVTKKYKQSVGVRDAKGEEYSVKARALQWRQSKDLEAAVEAGEPVKPVRKAAAVARGETNPEIVDQIRTHLNGREFRRELNAESMGGNAGVGHRGLRAIVDSEGRIHHFGNREPSQQIQTALERGDYHEIIFRVNYKTNDTITSVHGKLPSGAENNIQQAVDKYNEERKPAKKAEIIESAKKQVAEREAGKPSLVDEVAALVDERGALTRGGDYVKSLMKRRSDAEVEALQKWTQEHPSQFVRRFVGSNVAAELRARKTIEEAEKQAPQEAVKEPWEMTDREFRQQENETKVEAIKKAIGQRKPIQVRTQFRITPLTSPEHIRVVKNGDVQTREGRNRWVTLTADQVDSLAAQAGVKILPFSERTSHREIVETAIEEGKTVPNHVLALYPELVKRKPKVKRVKLEGAQPTEPKPKKPTAKKELPSLFDIIKQNGGINLGAEGRGEHRWMREGERGRMPGLFRTTGGMTFDDAYLTLNAYGYNFESTDDLMAAIEDEARGKRQYPSDVLVQKGGAEMPPLPSELQEVYDRASEHLFDDGDWTRAYDRITADADPTPKDIRAFAEQGRRLGFTDDQLSFILSHERNKAAGGFTAENWTERYREATAEIPAGSPVSVPSLSTTQVDRVREIEERLFTSGEPIEDFIRQGALLPEQALTPAEADLLREMRANRNKRRERDKSEQGALIETTPTVESRAEAQEREQKPGITFGLFAGAPETKPELPTQTAVVSEPITNTGNVETEAKPIANVTVGTHDEINAGEHDLRLAISRARNHYTLWAQLQKGGRWHYLSILGGNKTQAQERAQAAADRIAAGDLTGVAFQGKEKFQALKSIGLMTNELGPEQLMGAERVALGEQQVGFGKYSGILVKDLFAHDPGYVNWLVDNATGKRGAQLADYFRALPDFIASRDAQIIAAREAITPEAIETLAPFNITPSPLNDGNILLTGKTYDWKDAIKALGGRFSADDQAWKLPADRFGEFVAKLGGLPKPDGKQRSGLAAYQVNPRLGQLRKDADARPDRSQFEQPVSTFVSRETSELIERGRAIGMPAVVVDEQIEDIARINRAYQNDQRVFVLASEPGSGKTFVLGGAIRELQKAGAKKIVYVTLRNELITQIKDDLADYGIENVEFVTYPAMREAMPQATDVLIFDEAHSVKNVGQGLETVQQAKQAAKWMQNTKFTILSTATPFENPVQAAYLEPTGIFDRDFGSWHDFALAHGASEITLKDGNKIIVWKRTSTSDADAKAARDYLVKEGVFTSRRIRLPENQVDSRLVKVSVPEGAAKMYDIFTESASEHDDILEGFARAWIVNFQKRLLEAAKVDTGIKEADGALKRGRFPIIFVETKAERKIDIPELLAAEDDWNRAVSAAMVTHDKPPARSEYGLPPRGITEVLATFMDKTGTSVITIPSAEDIIIKHFGKDKTAIFTGSVTPTNAQRNLDSWRSGDKPVLVATMAKGGTGLSLHDKAGDHQTTQININLPWTATQVVQVTQRSARYGLKGQAEIVWAFADNIPFDRMLSSRVGGRMADMGAVVHGERMKGSAEIEDWDFEGQLFSEQIAAAKAEPAAEAQPEAGRPKNITENDVAAGYYIEQLEGIIRLKSAKNDNSLGKYASVEDAVRDSHNVAGQLTQRGPDGKIPSDEVIDRRIDAAILAQRQAQAEAAERANEKWREKMYGSKNKLVTKDEAKEALDRIKNRRKTERGSGGPSLEEIQDWLDIAVYHIEAGAREFADFVRAGTEYVRVNIGEPAAERFNRYAPILYERARRFVDTGEMHDLTGAKNALTESERALKGMAPVEKQLYTSQGTAYTEGRARAEADPTYARTLAAEIAAKPRPITTTEVGALSFDRMQIKNAHTVKMSEIANLIDEGKDPSSAYIGLAELESLWDANDQALQKAGREQSAAFNARKMIVRDDYEFLAALKRVKVASGKAEVPEKVRAQLEDLTKRYAEAEAKMGTQQERIDKLEAELAFKRIERESRKAKRATTKTELDDEFAKLKAQFAEARKESGRISASGFAAIDPEGKLTALVGKMALNRVKAGVNSIEALVDDIYAALEDQLQGLSKRDVRDAISGYGRDPKRRTRNEMVAELAKLRVEMRKLSKQEDIAAGKAESQQQKTRRTQLEKQIKDLQSRIESGQYEKPGKTPPVYDTSITRMVRERDKLKLEIDRLISKQKRTEPLDIATSVRQSMMLGNLIGVTQDIISTTAHNITATPQMVPAALLDAAQGMKTGQRVNTILTPLELGKAIAKGLAETPREAKEIARHGLSAKQAAEQEVPHEINSGMPAFDAIVNTISRVRSIADLPNWEVGLEIAKRESSKAVALTEARRGAITKDQVNKRAKEIYDTMTLSDQLDLAMGSAAQIAKMEATQDARVRTFKQDNAFSDFIRRALSGKSSKERPGARFVVRLILPFEKAMTNYIKAGFDLSGAGVFTGLARAGVNMARADKFASETTLRESQRKANLAFSRGITGGAGGLLLGYTLAGLGVIGDPRDDENRQKGRAASLHIGDYSFDIGWTGPLAVPLAIGAGFYHNQIEGAQQAFGRSMTQAPLVRGGRQLYNLAQVLESKGTEKAATALGQLGASLIPGVIKDVARLKDVREGQQVQREMKGFTGPLKGAIPVLRETLPERTPSVDVRRKAVDALRKGDSRPADELYDKGEITREQRKAMDTEAKLTALQVQFQNKDLEEKLKAYSGYSKTQKNEVFDIMMKALKEGRKNLAPAKRDRLEKQYPEMGLR